MGKAVTIKVQGVQGAINSLRAWEVQRRGRLGGAVALTALQGETHIKRLLSLPGTGRWYGDHRASAPGQPPATDTGVYRASWRHVITSPLSAAVQTNQERGPALEFGYAPRNLAPRPHAAPTASFMADQFVKNAKGALR